mgnify:CR=1 FL=1
MTKNTKIRLLNKEPLVISIIYFLFGFFWIFFSDKILLRLSSSADFYAQFQTYKGWIYVFITTIMIYILLKIYSNRRDRLMKDLQEKEKLYQTIFENTGTATMIIDKDFTISYANRQTENLLGLSREAIEGNRKWTDFIAGDDLARMKSKHKAILQNKTSKVKRYEFTLISENGVRKDTLITMGLIPDTLRVVASLTDVTELREVQKSLHREQNLMARLAQASPIGIILFDSHGQIIFVNQETSKILDRKKSGLLNQYYTDIKWKNSDLNDDQMGPEKPIFEQVKDSEKPINALKLMLEKQDGSKIYISTNATPLFDKRQKLEGVLITIQDITQRIQLKRQFQRAQKLDGIGKLAGGIAHDFNNLITVITGQAQIAEMEIENDHPVHNNLIEIIKATERAAKLTSQLLVFSRKQPMHKKPLNINNVIEDLSTMLKRLIGENINIHFDLTEDLWYIKGDESNIEQIIMNLSINARDAMPAGGDLYIRTGNTFISEELANRSYHGEPGKHVVLTIQDTGVGIDSEIINKIFDPFFSTKKKSKGTGLGLSVIYGIVTKHKGWIDVDSTVDKGSTFKIYFPSCPEPEEAKIKNQIEIENLKGNGEKILFIEDEPGILDYGRQLLEQNGYVVDSAKDASEAYQKFVDQEGNYDIIISDVVLPDFNGLDLVQDLRKRKPGLPVIMSSGYTDEKSKQSKIIDRGLPFIQKPYEAKDLLKTVKQNLVKT